MNFTVCDRDDVAAGAVARAWDCRTKPPGSLGRLEALAIEVARIQRSPAPRVARKVLRVFAGSHGIADEGVSAYGSAVNAAMLANFDAGGAAINVLCRRFGIDFAALDAGIGHPTRSFLRAAAMTGDELDAALALGASAVPDGVDIFAVGEMGIGNSTSAAALSSALLGRPAGEVTGRGTGVGDGTLARKVAVVHEAVTRHGADSPSAREWLRRVGGREIAAMTGAILRAAERRIPVVLDGLIATSAALVAVRIEPAVAEVLIAGHLSPEPAHRLLLDELRLDPVLDLGMRLGEGTGAAMAMNVIETAVVLLDEMATFESAGVPTS